MGNLTKKTITRGAVVALALSAGAATTANAAVTRVGGVDRYATSTQIAALWPAGSTTAVLAAGLGHDVDALTVAPLAKQKNAPIILVDTTSTTATIVAQFANYSTVYIANGSGVVSENVATALTAAGKTVIRLGGATRYETALNIAKAFGAANNIVVANGDNAHLVDSLSIASIAAAKGMPIFLSSANAMDAAQTTYAKGLGATNVYVLGGSSLVSDAAVTGLGKEVRLAGAGRYETNAAVVTAFKADAALDLTKIYVASGEDANLIDSLTAGPLAGLKKAPIVFAHNSINADVNTLLKSVVTSTTDITVLGGTGAVSADAMTAIQNIQTPTGTLAVSSVAATGAKTIKVVFSQAPADTAKVVFAVTRGTSTATVTPTWNAAKTEAVLTSVANFASGEYSVNVKNDTTDLGTSKVSFTEQKIAKLAITSTKLGVVSTTVGTKNVQTGYATYKVYDQYGGDITNSSLGNGVTFQSGVSSDMSWRNGLLKLVASDNLNLISFTAGVTITGNDMTSGISTSATLAVTSQVGTLSDISLTALTNADATKVLTAGNDTDVFYVTYSALDVSGNATANYDLVKSGLIYSDSTLQTLTTSNPNVTATLVKDPADSNKAAIEVKANTESITLDTPVIITAMTWTGKVSQLNVTLKKQSTATTFTLMTPAYDVASNESKEIPYSAVDQDGNAITKAVDILSDVTFSGTIKKITNADGTLTLKNEKRENLSGSSIPEVLTATTSTGKYSSITLNIQKAAVADTLAVDTSVIKTTMQMGAPIYTGTVITSYDNTNGALQKLDFGQDNGGLSVNDQYGRAIDMTTADKAQHYIVVATTSVIGAGIIQVEQPSATSGKTQIQLRAVAPGSTSVTFNLYDTSVNDTTNTYGKKIVDTITKTFSVVKDGDIKDYGMDAVTSPIYTALEANDHDLTHVTAAIGDYKANPGIYGKTSGGTHVALRDGAIVGASVDSGDFTVTSDATGGNAGDVKVIANKLADATKTGSSTLLSVTLKGADGNIHSLSTTIKSSNAGRIAAALNLAVSTELPGISQDGDVVTVDTTKLVALGLGGTGYLTKFAPGGLGGNPSAIHFDAVDQYGQKSMALSNITIASQTVANAIAVDADGNLTGITAATTGKVVITATVGGFIKTVEIDFVSGNTQQ